MSQVRELPHTADLGFEAEAASLPELFGAAARGLVQCLGAEREPEGSVAATAAREADPQQAPLELERPDLERLLVAWLGELLYRAGRAEKIPRVSDIEVHAGPAARLRARVRWEPYPAGGPTREIKGVTYHGLRVGERAGRWHARVVLDV